MTVISKAAQAARKLTRPSGPRLLIVKDVWRLTPNMMRVIFAGPELDGFPLHCEGGNCKLLLPEPSEPKQDFATRLQNDPAPVKRTYTVRKYDADKQELTIDFVAHGDVGPASRWASAAKAGDFLGFAGPSGPKVDHFEADWYLVAADASAIPVAAVTLEAMPRNASGVAIFELTSLNDRQKIDAPDGVEIHWLVQPDSHLVSRSQEKLIRSLDWPTGRVQTCIAGESSVIRSLRAYLTTKDIEKRDMYISGYWKIGLVEDEHQQAKRAEF